MADNPDFYRARAQQERDNADAAVLDNVRDRCDRAAKAWTDMADRAEQTLTLRLTREAATRAGIAERALLAADADEVTDEEYLRTA